MRFGGAIEPAGIHTVGRWALQGGVQALLDKGPPDPAVGRRVDLDRPRNRRVRPGRAALPLVRFEQDPGMG